MSYKAQDEDLLNNGGFRKTQNRFDIEYILSEIDIIDFLEIEFNLVFEQTTNGEYRCNCPFYGHRDSTPSFDVNREKGVFICRGCSQGGNIINFLMHMENISFTEALNRLSSLIGDTTQADFHIHRMIKQIDQLTVEYLDKTDLEPYPAGLSESKFLTLLNQIIRNYENEVTEDSEEIKWIDLMYKNIDDLCEEQNYQALTKLFYNLSSKISERKKEWKQKNGL